MKTLGWMISLGLLASTGKVIDFDGGQLGKTPAGWSVVMANRGAAPRWEIRRDRTAPTQPYVLAQLSSDPAANRAPLAILNNLSLRDGDVSVRIKPVAGRQDPGGGLVWRYRDEKNYYLVRTNVAQNTVAVDKVENGRRITLVPGVKHDMPLNTWSILKVSARGNRFQIYVDHRRILSGVDNTFTGPGKVGLCTMGDSVTYFDDFRVYPR
jgi:hypothetical protein